MDLTSKLFNPATQSKEWLIEHFVVRNKVFTRIFEDISSSEMKFPEQNYIIQGQRGMGKTTLLLRLKYEIENTPHLNNKIIPVYFSEESYDLTSLSNLWEKLLKYLDDVWNTKGDLYKHTDQFIGQSDYEKKCFDYLIQTLKQKNKKLVILFDNFGDLFLANLKERESHRLREILITNAEIRIIAGSSIVMEDFHQYQKPFFDFFKIIYLDPLTKEETVQLIEKLQDTSIQKINIIKNKAKIETLAILTGGVIRTIILLYEVLLSDEDGSALRDLEIILDRITPLYKHRMEILSLQQRKIVDIVAKSWDAISAKKISQKIREDGKPIKSKIISAQLQQLERNNLIEKKLTTTKNNLYQLKERFFNIWYLMRNGDRNDKMRVIWLTRYLELIYGNEEGEFSAFIKNFVDNIKKGGYYPDSALTLADAITSSDKIDHDEKKDFVSELKKFISSGIDTLESKVDEEFVDQATSLYNKNEFDKAIKLLEKVNITEPNAGVTMSLCLLAKSNINSAIDVLNKINFNDTTDPDLLEVIYFIKGTSHYLQKDYSAAEKDFQRAASINLKPSIKMLAKIYKEQKKYDLSEKYYLQALEGGDLEDYWSLFMLYIESNKIDQGIEIFSNEYKKHRKYANYFLGELFSRKEQYERAEEYLKEAINSKVNLPNAYLSLGLISQKLHRNINVTIEYLEKALKLSNSKQNKRFSEKSIKLLLAALYFLENIEKERALTFVQSFIGNKYNSTLDLIIPLIFAWDNQFKRAIEEFGKINLNNANGEIEFIDLLITLLIAKKQYYSALELFDYKSFNLKDLIKPTYYALMNFLKKDFPDEYIKMGQELEDPLKEKLKVIEQYSKKYNQTAPETSAINGSNL